jgi:hypothetical protein
MGDGLARISFGVGDEYVPMCIRHPPVVPLQKGQRNAH